MYESERPVFQLQRTSIIQWIIACLKVWIVDDIGHSLNRI